MKKVLYILLPILAVFVAVFVVLFTPFGSNAVIKPIVNSKIQTKIKKPKIEITKLDSKIGYINIDAISNNGVKTNIDGDISYFAQKFDLNYKINAKSVKIEDKDIKVDLNLNGQVVGSAKNFGVNGQGNAFDSDINYKFIIKNNNPQSIVTTINSAQIAKIFATLNQVPLIDGLLFINANMPSLDIKSPKGRANIEIKDGRFNRSYINKKFKILLPKDEKFVAKIKTAVMKKYILGSGDLNTTTAKLKLKKLTATLDFKKAKGYYTLNINNLIRLSPIVKTKLQGKLSLTGAFYLNLPKKIYQVTINTNSLGGILKAKYSTNSVKLKLKNISVVKVLKILSQPFYVTSGTVNGIVNITNIAHLNGEFNILAKGVLNKKLLKVKLPSYKYKIEAKGRLKDSILNIKRAKLLTNFVNLNLTKLKYSLLTNTIKSNFFIQADNLRALNTFTKQNFKGKIKAAGTFAYNAKKLNVSFSTKSLGGILKANYKKDKLVSKFRDISIEKLLYILNQPHFIKSSKLSGDVEILSVEKLNGKFTIKSIGSIDTKTLERLYNVDLGNLFKYSLLIKDAIIKRGRILTRPKLNTSYGSIAFEYLNYDINKKALSAKYNIKIDDLRRLKTLTKQNLIGSFALKGEIKQNPNQLIVTGVANELGGVINFMLENDNIKLKGAGLSVLRVLRLLNYEQVLDGVAKVDLKYNKKIKKGNFKLILNEARFLNSKLVSMLKQYANFDLSKEVFSSAIIEGTIDKNIITFNLDTSSQRVKISTKDAKISTKEQTINARVKIVHKNQEYNFRVSGPIKDPHYKIIFSGYIKNKVKKKVLKELEKTGVTKEIKKEIKKVIPNEIKSLKEDNKTKEQIKKIIPKKVKGLFDKLL